MMNKMQLRVCAKIENDGFVRMCATAFLVPLSLSMDTLMEIKTVLAEAVVNAIIHAYDEHDDAYVDIMMMYDQRQIVMEIKDYGCGIEDINKARVPLYTSKAHLERSGMGMTIMETFCDEFEIESHKNFGTHIRMVKYLGKE
ncbi:MAG: anti-sigma F factor [Longicatena sp.]|nr:anti-sigma F factor [Longicatena sp.]